MISRRNFVKTAGLLSLSGAFAPNFLAQTVAASSADLAQGKRALVVVQMGGGNDGLNTVVPYTDSTYYNLRPTLAIKASDVLQLDNALGLNPALKPLMDLYSQGHLAIVRGASYPNPNYSHFRSMAIWQSAQADLSSPTSGWLGRYVAGQSGSVGPANLPRLGMAVGEVAQGAAPLAFTTDKTIVLSFNGLNNFQFKADALQADRTAQLEAARAIYNTVTQNSVAEYIRTTALDALAASSDFANLANNYQPAVTYPKTNFASSLQTVAQLLNADYGTRIFYVGTDGSYDTHRQQAQTHSNLLQDLAEGLGAFYQDLAAHNLDDSVMTLTFSEFGRRVAENGSLGTDHGSAEPMFVLGGKNSGLKAGLYGTQPSLTNLNNGNMIPTVDFRSVYSTVLKNWLGVDPQPIIGGDFPLLPFI